MPMSHTRRDCLRLLAAGAVGVAELTRARQASSAPAPVPARRKLHLLILGGTGFLGPATVEAALGRGHQVTLFHRGKTRPDLFPGVEKLHGDRDPRKEPGLVALRGRRFDAVIDNSGYFPRIVAASAQLLAPSVGQYIYISSVSAYKEPIPERSDETAALATLTDPTVEDMGPEMRHYGGLKVLCEQAVERALPGRATVVRPGFIVGPDDPSGRFTYWPARFARGGEVAVPGAPADPLQVIDVRDLGPWLIRLAEDRAMGVFNACGDSGPWGRVVALCQGLAPAGTRPVWIPADFIEKQKDIEFPIWAPPQGDTRFFHSISNRRAVQRGLRFRPLGETVKDTLAWYQKQVGAPQGRVRLAGPTPELEADLLRRWAAAQARR